MPALNPEALLTGAAWGAGFGTPQVVTYSFAQDGAGGFGHGLAAWQWAGFSPAQQAAARQALAAWAAAGGLSFVEVPDTLAGVGVDLRFRLEDFGNLAMAGESYGPPFGTIALSLPLFGADSLAPSASRIGFTVLLHEIGHALGLKHPWEGDVTLDPALDTTDTTVMAYSFGRAGLATAPRPLDALAVQELYGPPGASSVAWRFDASAGAVFGQGGTADETLAAPDYGAVLAGGGGNDTLLGGAGLDVALFAGSHAAAQVNLGAGTVATAGGTTHFQGVEALAFGDGHLAIGTADPAAVLARLYQVALDRTPDLPGLTDWLGRMQAGLSLHEAAGLFLQSPEYLARHAGLDDAGFAALLAAQGGTEAVALAQLAAGQDRASVLLAAAQGDPAIAATDALLASGLWVPLADGAAVARLYHLVLGRAPDAPGWAKWLTALEGGETLAQLAGDFLGSVEFRQGHGAATPMNELAEALEHGLGQAPGAALLAGWEAQLAAGAPLAEVMAALVQDAGVMAALRPVTEPGILFA